MVRVLLAASKEEEEVIAEWEVEVAELEEARFSRQSLGGSWGRSVVLLGLGRREAEWFCREVMQTIFGTG